ncbi:22101_t:CDS:1, partial [Cetraspora pellucida]
YRIDFYMMDLVQGMYMMLYISQVQIPSSIKEMNLFVNELETLLKVREIFCNSFDALYSKLSTTTKSNFQTQYPWYSKV